MSKASQQETPSSYALAGGLASLLLITVLLYLGRIFFITLICAVMLAFLLEPLVKLFMRIKLPRAAASFLACAMLLGVVYLLGLGLWIQALGLWEDRPAYTRRVAELVDSASAQVDNVEKTIQDVLVPKRLRDVKPVPQEMKPLPSKQKRKTAPAPPQEPVIGQQDAPLPEVRIHQDDSPLASAVYAHLSDFYDIALMASFVPFLVYFFLSWREHFREALLNLVKTESQKKDLQRAWEGIAHVARAYLVGNFLLGIVVSVASSIFFWFVKLPYWQVVGPMSGFLSLVPYLGLPLALIPPFVAALPVYSGLPAYLIIGATTAAFHLIALNLLYPKLVGARVHLNPVVVTVALMLWYLLWGGAGLVLAIPVTAGMKAAFDNIPALRGYGKLLGD
jgi:predicted PurR-regulated permease PerM